MGNVLLPSAPGERRPAVRQPGQPAPLPAGGRRALHGAAEPAGEARRRPAD